MATNKSPPSKAVKFMELIDDALTSIRVREATRAVIKSEVAPLVSKNGDAEAIELGNRAREAWLTDTIETIRRAVPPSEAITFVEAALAFANATTAAEEWSTVGDLLMRLPRLQPPRFVVIWCPLAGHEERKPFSSWLAAYLFAEKNGGSVALVFPRPKKLDGQAGAQ